MNANAQQRLAFQISKERGVADSANSTSPVPSNAVNNRSRGELTPRPEIAHLVQPRGVFDPRIARGALSFLAEQPCRSHETSRLEIIRAKFISRGCNSMQGFIVVQVVKFTFLLRVKSREELVVETLLGAARALMKIPVNDDFMTVRLHAP